MLNVTDHYCISPATSKGGSPVIRVICHESVIYVTGHVLPRTQTSLFKTHAQRKAGRRRLYPSHGPLRFITSQSFGARPCHAKRSA